MAYNRSDRFPPQPKYYRISDPGAYQHECPPPTCSHRNVRVQAPFLSKAHRVTSSGNPIWTQAYYKGMSRKIVPNCTSMKSKVPRFPYEAFSEKDLEDILCRCGLEPACECPTGLEQPELKEPVICQGKVRTQLFKGSVPQPLTNDETYELRKPNKFVFDQPFYDTRLKESTAFYHGCKWSKRSVKKELKPENTFPGPTDYNVSNLNLCGKKDSCAEQIQFLRKKYSRQLRYIEQLTEQHLLENRPGPASYNPKVPKGTELLFLGSRSERFTTSKYQIHPGPADHFLKRDFDPVDCEEYRTCLAKLPQRSCFGTKSPRFKHRVSIGPSPADYNVNNKMCRIVLCNKAPFGSTVSRFKNNTATHVKNMKKLLRHYNTSEDEDTERCPKPTWSFRSKLNRFSLSIRDPYSPSPADTPQPCYKQPPPEKVQKTAPFLSSDMRFSQWFNWIPIHQRFKTPGPGYYKPEKARCSPAVYHGPLSRTCRFTSHSTEGPAPNTYNVGGGVETVLKTFNKNLFDNTNSKQDLILYKDKPISVASSLREKELKLLLHCLSILDYGEDLFSGKEESPAPNEELKLDVTKKKMLRYFLYKHHFRRQC